MLKPAASCTAMNTSVFIGKSSAFPAAREGFQLTADSCISRSEILVTEGLNLKKREVYARVGRRMEEESKYRSKIPLEYGMCGEAVVRQAAYQQL